MRTEGKNFRYNATTIFYWNRYSSKSFLDKAVNVWVLYPEPNKKTSQLLILRCTLLECLILWWKASKRPISHSVFEFETLTTQRGSNWFICLMSRYFLLSVGSKIEAFFDERKARARRVPVPPNKEQKKKRLMKTPEECWRRDACMMVALSDNTDIKRSRSGPRHGHNAPSSRLPAW